MVGASQTELDYRSRTLWFILLSLIIHSTVMLILSREWSTNPSSAATAIEVIEMTSQQIDKLKAQIVETALLKKSEHAVKDAFLGAQTQVVARQTKASVTAPYRDGKTGGKPQVQQEKTVAMGDLGVKLNLKPMGSLGPGEMAATSDYLRGLQPGAQTLLNTREYAYFSFYQRVRQQLEQYWEPGLRNRLKGMFERGRQLAADKEHATRLTVVMSSDGSITRVIVDGTSGLLDLDQAAIDAFNRAGPFPNPPKGLVEHDGTVKIEWEFVLKT